MEGQRLELQNYSPLVDETGNRRPETGINVILRNVYNIIRTPKRSVAFGPDIGSNLYKYLFEQLDQTLISVITSELYNDIVRWEDRFDNLTLTVVKDVQNHMVGINVAITLHGTTEELHVSASELAR